MKFCAGKQVAIVDCGLGNLFNVRRAFELVGTEPTIVDDPNRVLEAERLVLPGVGAFADGMKGLEERKLTEPIFRFANSGRPILGICLGMQLLMTVSEEYGIHKGLNLIPGKVIRFKEPPPVENENEKLAYKIPQLGWNRLLQPVPSGLSKSNAGSNPWKDTIFRDLSENAYMYFMHSYCVFPEKESDWLSVTFYGQDRYCSALKRNNIMGCQFHPERSGEEGLSILRNFVLCQNFEIQLESKKVARFI